MAAKNSVTWYVYVGNNPDAMEAMAKELANGQIVPNECRSVPCKDLVVRNLFDVQSLRLAETFVELAKSKGWPGGIFCKKEPDGKVRKWKFSYRKTLSRKRGPYAQTKS